MMHRIGLLLTIGVAAGAIEMARGQATPPASAPAVPTPAPEDIPWPVKLGLRSLQISMAFPVIDRVVLVPDGATYLDELSKWSPQGRWPVLLEDSRFAPMFIRRFKPAQLIRRDSTGTALPAEQQAQRAAMEAIVIRTFGGDPSRQSVRDAFIAQKYVPPGIVIASTEDPAWTAALALAAGRGQPLAWLDGAFGAPDQDLNDSQANELVRGVNALVAQHSSAFQAMGDELDAITLCRSISCKANVVLPESARFAHGGPHAQGPISITDLLGRNGDGSRYAITGWIFGDEVRSAYMAMCSLFLPRENVWCYNTYSTDGDWGQYAMDQAVALLSSAGYAPKHFTGFSASDKAWLRSLAGGWSADVLVMNSKGNADFFELSSGRCTPHDVPLLTMPMALHLTHSWSMAAPSRLDTVGAQWLENGTYAAVGSCWEPFLGAFVTPVELTRRTVSLVPFLAAARWWDNQGPFCKVWRIVTIGDPLMLCGPPEQLRHARVAVAADYGVDLGDEIKSLLRQAQANEPNEQAIAKAGSILNLLGNDEVVIGWWRLADSKGKGSAAARSALGALFRSRSVDDFLRAWDQLPERDPEAVHMLWHLLGPRLMPGNAIDRTAVSKLQANIRHPLPQADLERLTPHIVRFFGEGQARDVIQRELRKTADPGAKQALTDLLNKM